MKKIKTKKIYFIVGSQELYGEKTLRQVTDDAKIVAEFLNKNADRAEIVFSATVTNREIAESTLLKANCDADCIGVIVWMHTFSPAKMWIRGLRQFNKPLLHLHTQFNQKLPYAEIDMDFMNLNQSAHGDREFGYICTRLGIKRDIVAGYYKNKRVIDRIKGFIDVAAAIDFSSRLKAAMFGNNMRDVAVTDGDRVESEIRYGWNVNYYGIGDLVDIINDLQESEIDAQVQEYSTKYVMNTDCIDSVREQAKYEVALKKFMTANKIDAFTDTFEDLHGLNQLPGLAIQDLMADSVGFGPEGDYKTSCLMAVLCEMAKYRNGATAFLEDYTYDLTENNEVELASHMLEVSPVFAKDKPKIEVYPLSIGGKNPPARLVFSGIGGKGIAVSMIDMGNRFRLVCAEIALMEAPEKMPALPVAQIMWKILPDFPNGLEQWIKAGGGHHSVVSTALTKEDMILFAELTDTEIIFVE